MARCILCDLTGVSLEPRCVPFVRNARAHRTDSKSTGAEPNMKPVYHALFGRRWRQLETLFLVRTVCEAARSLENLATAPMRRRTSAIFGKRRRTRCAGLNTKPRVSRLCGFTWAETSGAPPHPRSGAPPQITPRRIPPAAHRALRISPAPARPPLAPPPRLHPPGASSRLHPPGAPASSPSYALPTLAEHLRQRSRRTSLRRGAAAASRPRAREAATRPAAAACGIVSR